jgi:hypothetical protein
MSEDARVQKAIDKQLPLPPVWKQPFIAIVDAFCRGDFQLAGGVAWVRPIAPEDAERIAGNIEGYGDQLIGLNDEAWRTSVHLWNGRCWEVLLDLCTAKQGQSDLVLFADVYEAGDEYEIEIQDVHVP